MSHPISDTGLSVVYASEEGNPLLDIVIVHGLQGHPFKTWASTKTPKVAPSAHQSSLEVSQDDAKRGHASILRRISSKISARSSGKITSIESRSVTPLAGNANNDSAPVYWPRDLAPQNCPKSRILVFGYDTKISKYLTSPTNKNHVLSHGKDLLFAVGRRRPHNRPLLFIAHSLGGIVVKEALAASSTSADASMKNVIESTEGVIFMGTPHRGSSDLSDLGERARMILSAFRMETNSAILDTLGLRTSDLERAQESFSRLWQDYGFKVKTFQEGLGLTGVHLGILGDKVVPDYSSLLGNHRERAETIQANHMEMCRFTGATDPNYVKLAGELDSIYELVQVPGRAKIHDNGLLKRQALSSQNEPIASTQFNVVQNFCQKLEFPTMKHRYRTIARPADRTCSWLFEHEKYRDWLEDRNSYSNEGLLLLQGKPGAGKSVLMKEAHRRMSLENVDSADIIATCFFNGLGGTLDHTRTGMYRSLLYQLLPLYEDNASLDGSLRDDEKALSLGALRNFFESLFCEPQQRRTFLFIDALDECRSPSSLAYYWRRITRTAYAAGGQLHVLISMRHFPHTTLANCPVILVDRCNRHDIELYVEQQLHLVAMPEQVLVPLKTSLTQDSRGIFVWVMLMVERMIEKWDAGEGLSTLLEAKLRVPRELSRLYTKILATIDAELKGVTIRLFQWASLAVVPLRLHEWHHILAFIRRPKFQSLHAWRASEYFTESDDQLERLIKSLSRGLLEVRPMPFVVEDGQEATSTMAGAGSLDNSHGETRVVEFIHESVCEFFLQGRGFPSLDPGMGPNVQAAGHLQIMETCLDYLDIFELNGLVEARYSKPEDGSMRSQSTDSSIDQNRPLGPQDVERHDEFEEYQPNSSKRERKTTERHDFLESLKALSSSTTGIDIRQWQASNEFQIRQGTYDESVCDSVVHSSVGASTKLLQDYPALLSYATDRLISHAQQAQVANADPEAIVKRLQGGSWNRWLVLSERSPPFIHIQDFIKIEGLTSWSPYIAPDAGAPRSGDTKFQVIDHSINQHMTGHPQTHAWPHNASSVERFGSASSHRNLFPKSYMPDSDKSNLGYLARTGKTT
ncbi:hypothetical protein E8E14_001444 [Neopestalotiopsis sp. 37M]|nr:hypothetical protein E8E14_001444 [Neopestalotiopsis sp. 37M]